MKNWIIGIGLVFIVILLFICLFFLSMGNHAMTESEQTMRMSNSSIESANDSIDALNNQLEVEKQENDSLRNATDAVYEAPNSHAAHAAGTDFLCKKYAICS